METRSNNLLVGVVTLALLFALAGFTVWLANAGGSSRVEYDVFFKQSVDGLNRGSGVLFSGVPAGQVTEIALWRPDPQFVRVRIEVDEDIPVLQGTTAALQGVGFTGVSQIQLEGAIAGAPAITDNGPAGRPVIPARTGGLGELLNTAPQLVERISTLTERLTELTSDENQQSFSNILTNVEGITGNVEDVTGELRGTGPELNRTLAEARLATQQAARAAEQIARLAATTENLVDSEGRPLMRDLRTAVVSAERSIRALETAIQQAQPGLTSFSGQTIPEANALLRDLRRSATTLSNVAERIEQQGAGSLLGQRLPDYEPEE
jgi:phospholipid/cholesterol/gamma-HCH transport system substrate-binding protein